MPKMHIERSIVIHAPISDIYSQLNNFTNWQKWSPWLIMEPDARLALAEDAKSYEWEGSRVGVGNMKIVSEEEATQVNYELNFVKPWKSSAEVRFVLQPLNPSQNSDAVDAVKVTWSMNSSLPFFMFFMKNMMEAFVGADYERGLALLKVYIETGEIPFKLDFLGSAEFTSIKYIGVQNQCSLDQIGDKMEGDFDAISGYLEAFPDLANGPAFSIYHDWDIVKSSVNYTSGVSVANIPSDLPGNFTSGEIPSCKVYKISHTGPYEYLGNGWSALYAMDRNKEFQKYKKLAPFELYMNNPAEVSQNELLTEICLPIK